MYNLWATKVADYVGDMKGSFVTYLSIFVESNSRLGIKTALIIPAPRLLHHSYVVRSLSIVLLRVILV